MATSINIPALNNAIRSDVPDINTVIKALAKNDPSLLTDLESGTKRIIEGSSGWEFQQYNGTSWIILSKFNINAQQVDGFDASASVVANTIPVRNAEGEIPGDITGNAHSADTLSDTLSIEAGGTGATTPANARTNLGVPPTNHASTATTHGIGTSTNYGHVKLSDATDSTSAASAGIAASPKAVSTGLDGLMDDVITAANSAVSGNTSLIQQVSARVDEIAQNKADKFVNNKGVVRSVNGHNADGDGNVSVDVGGLTLGTVLPYTGKDVPAGFLRADGATYTGMDKAFPGFYEWVVNSGLTVPLADYVLVEGSCGYYGLDTSNGTVRMPTLAAGVFGTVEAGKYPWIIFVYTAAVPASVAQAGEFVELLDGKADVNLGNVTAEGKAEIVGWMHPDYTAPVTISALPYTAPAYGYIVGRVTATGATEGFLYINDILVGQEAGDHIDIQMFVAAGDIVTGKNINNRNLTFLPLKG